MERPRADSRRTCPAAGGTSAPVPRLGEGAQPAMPATEQPPSRPGLSCPAPAGLGAATATVVGGPAGWGAVPGVATASGAGVSVVIEVRCRSAGAARALALAVSGSPAWLRGRYPGASVSDVHLDGQAVRAPEPPSPRRRPPPTLRRPPPPARLRRLPPARPGTLASPPRSPKVGPRSQGACCSLLQFVDCCCGWLLLRW